MERELREKIRAATEESGITKPDFIALLKLIDQQYDKMEATITQSIQAQTQAPLEAIFDSITDAFLAVDGEGIIRNCNKVCARYFGPHRSKLIGTHIGKYIPGLGDTPLPLPAISRVNAWVGSSVPRKFRLNTNSMPFGSRS